MFANALGIEFKTFENRDFRGKPARVVIAAAVYDTEPADLWDALTNAERLPRWFLPVEGDLKLGGRYQTKGNAGGVIEHCDPPTAFDITWEFAGATSWVSVRLAPEGSRTRLTLEHIFATSDADTHWANYGPAAVGVGWDTLFVSLRHHITTGAPVESTAAHAWMASDDGKAFMRKSAADWAAAHIAGGAAPDVARGMAERTAKFYTGG